MNDLISKLSEIRSNYNCMDEKEEPYYRALSEAIQLVSAQPERTGRKMTNAEAIETLIANYPDACFEQLREAVDAAIKALKAQPEIIRCKDCRFFEYDHPYIVQGVPVLGHLVCAKWGDGCRTAEDGFCFMAERRTDDLQ